uniref:Uncharacterized protein n=1 Tax=Aegilops tauschii subsp. strangulata TaxID=200361 RepID=A0A453T224_AEGTS
MASDGMENNFVPCSMASDGMENNSCSTVPCSTCSSSDDDISFNTLFTSGAESIQTTAEDVLELPLLPPEDVATPSKHKLSDQSTHNNPPEDVATPRTATTRAQSSALSEAAENRSEVFDAPNLVSVLVSRPKMHRPSASPRRQSSRRRSSHWLRRRLVPILERL